MGRWRTLSLLAGLFMALISLQVSAETGALTIQVQADDEKSASLPIGEDEYLAITMGRKTLSFYDREGNLVSCLQNAALAASGEAAASMDTAELRIVKKDDPVPVCRMGLPTDYAFPDDNRGTYVVGLYLPAENRFLISPGFASLKALTDRLWTDEYTPGSLFDSQGVNLPEGEGKIFYAFGGYLFGRKFQPAGTVVYDQDLTPLLELEGEPAWIDGERIIMTGLPGTAAYDCEGNRLWETGAQFMGAFGQYLTWGNGTDWNLTDLERNRVMDIARLTEINPEAEGIQMIQFRSASEDNSRNFLGVFREGGRLEFWLCDDEFRHLETIPPEELLFMSENEEFSHFQGRRTQPWKLSGSDGVYSLKNLLTEEEHSFTLPGEVPQPAHTGVLYRYGNTFFVGLSRQNWEMDFLCVPENEEAFFVGGGTFLMREDIVKLVAADGTRYFFDRQGRFLGSGDKVFWISPDGRLQAARHGSYLYVEIGPAAKEDAQSAGGELYLRILMDDEEEDEMLSVR